MARREFTFIKAFYFNATLNIVLFSQLNELHLITSKIHSNGKLKKFNEKFSEYTAYINTQWTVGKHRKVINSHFSI